jgi:hypothetical protein
MSGTQAFLSTMAFGGQALEHSPQRLQLETSMTGFTAINRFKALMRNSGALESDAVNVFSKFSITSGSTCAPYIVTSSK